MEKIKKAIEILANYNKLDAKTLPINFSAFRGLMNITMPYDLSEEYYTLQDEVIQDYCEDIKFTNVDDIPVLEDKISLYLGDITHIKADAIVNACNSELLGCFHPLHNCIDNAIHSFAGLEVRRDLINIMNEQGRREENGKAKITKGYNLPSKFILHTVGPIVNGTLTNQNIKDLGNCYLSCLRLAEEKGLKNIVFCSISTGLYGFPIREASKIAVNTVKEYLKERKSTIDKVVFNVFSKEDYDVYYRTIKKSN